MQKLDPPTDSLCDTNPKFTASSFWRCNLICTSWFCYHCSTVVCHNWLLWEDYRSPRWIKWGNTHSLQLSQVSCKPRVETANSRPPFLIFPFSKFVKFLLRDQRELLGCFHPVCRGLAQTEPACYIQLPFTNICWFQDRMTGHLILIKHLKQLLCEFPRCPPTRLVCFHWADRNTLGYYGSPRGILKLLLWRWLIPGVFEALLSRFEG